MDYWWEDMATLRSQKQNFPNFYVKLFTTSWTFLERFKSASDIKRNIVTVMVFGETCDNWYHLRMLFHVSKKIWLSSDTRRWKKNLCNEPICHTVGLFFQPVAVFRFSLRLLSPSLQVFIQFFQRRRLMIQRININTVINRAPSIDPSTNDTSFLSGSFLKQLGNPCCTDHVFLVQASNEPKGVSNQSPIYTNEHVVSKDPVFDASFPNPEIFERQSKKNQI